MSLSIPLLCAALVSVCSPGENTNADTTPPAITLNTPDTVTLFAGDEYSEAGAVALDDRDGELSVVVSGSVGSEPGTYTITYTATDAAGNTSQASLNVIVIDGDFDLFTASATRIVAEMTLEQKVGQMIQPEIAYITLEEISQYGIGSVLNGGGSHPYGNRSASPEAWLQFARELREASLKRSASSLGIPLIWGTDAVHGHNNLRGATIFPHNVGLGAINDPDLIGEIATATAREVGATGIDWTFAPTLAQAKDYRWGRTYESYSDDPAIVEAYGRVMVERIEAEGIAATAKHFIGDGGTQAGVDQGSTLIASRTQLMAEHGSGYIGAFEADVDTVMATFNSINDVKVHGSKSLLTSLLRDELNFNGMVISDWNGIGQVSGCSNASCAQAINAGIDMIMVPTEWLAFRNNLIEQVQRGDVSESRIDESVTRIIDLKQKLGLITLNFDPSRQPASVVGSPEHRAIAREAVRRSQVLLKNNNSTLPLNPEQRILLVGPAADSIPLQAGGWSVTWQGTGTTNADFPGATTIREAFSDVVEAAGGTLEYSSAGSYASLPDVVIVVLSEQPYAEGNGDLQNLDWTGSPLPQMQLLRDAGVPVVTLLMSGRPMFVNPELNLSDAFVASWLPGTEAAGIADVLFTDALGSVAFDMTGKLSFSWPGGAINPIEASSPVTANLFERSYGLSYDDTTELPQLTESLTNNQSGIVEGTGSEGGGSGGNVNPDADPFWVFQNGSFTATFDLGTRAFDSSINFDLCVNDNGEGCPSISWSYLSDSERGTVLEVLHEPDAPFAALFTESSTGLDLSDYQSGNFVLDLKHIEGPNNYRMKLDCFYPCESGHIDLNVQPGNDWQTVKVPISAFTSGGLDITKINTGIVIWARDHDGTRFRIDNVRFEAK